MKQRPSLLSHGAEWFEQLVDLYSDNKSQLRELAELSKDHIMVVTQLLFTLSVGANFQRGESMGT